MGTYLGITIEQDSHDFIGGVKTLRLFQPRQQIRHQSAELLTLCRVGCGTLVQGTCFFQIFFNIIRQNFRDKSGGVHSMVIPCTVLKVLLSDIFLDHAIVLLGEFFGCVGLVDWALNALYGFLGNFVGLLFNPSFLTLLVRARTCREHN